MAKLRGEVTVLSLGAEMRLAELRQARERWSLEVLVRHFLDRLLTNEAFGEDTAARIVQLAYAIALPGLLVALFLFPAYHGIPPGPRAYWAQACDHMFYVTYALTVMGAVTLFQWELLFPDVTDVYVLGTLPLRRGEQLLGRAAALVLFLFAVLVGTNLLGAIFFPAVADLKGMWWKHLGAHCAAVTLSGVFAAALFVAFQGVLVCVLRASLFRRISALLQAACLAVLLMVFFLFPVFSHFLEALLGSGRREVLWFPPFWFLGIYERLLWGGHALPIFGALAARGLAALGVAVSLAAILFPLAYMRRRQQLIEGTGVAAKRARRAGIWQALIDRWVVRQPPGRAVYHLIGQTLTRSARLQLYLAMYGGIGLALVVSGLMLFRVGSTAPRLELSIWGLRSAAPVVAFWAIVGLRTALGSPVGRAGRWIFGVVGGRPKAEQIRAVQIWVLCRAFLLTGTTELIVLAIGPAQLHHPRALVGQALVVSGICVLLTDFFFGREQAIPFTEARVSTTVELPFIFVRYFFVFPALILTVVGWEDWIEASWAHLLKASLLLIAAHALMVWWSARRWQAQNRLVDMVDDESVLPGLGLRG